MATITTRAGKGSPLTNTEVDNNFTNINTELGQKESASNKGVANGYASLDGSGKVPSTQLPSYVDDVVEGANLAAFPATGETGKIYVTLDTNKTYRWSGSAYVEISASPGSTDAVTEGSTNLYFTNARARSAISATGSLSYNSSTGVMSFTDAVTSVSGKTGAVTLTNSDVGLGNVENKSSATIRGELTSGNVTTALGYTPYNSSNPSNYITSSASITGNAATATSLQTARNINGTSFNGSANITTASWGTARTITIGSTGKSVDGSGNVSWTLGEIGAVGSGNTMTVNAEYSGTIAQNQTGWYTIASYGSGRAEATFHLSDQDSSRHNYVRANIVWSYGYGGIVVDTSGRHGVSTIRNIRLLYNTSDRTYGGVKVQVYCEGTGDQAWTLRVRQETTTTSGWGNFTEITPALEGTPAGWAEGYQAYYVNEQGQISTSSSSAYFAGNLALHAGNYSSYALPLSGGTLTGTLTGTTGRFQKNQTAGNYTTAALWTESYGNTATGVAFHISGNVGKFLEMRTDGILYWNGDTVIHSGNYNSWAPSLTGSGASGTWSINITGNAATSTVMRYVGYAGDVGNLASAGTGIISNYNTTGAWTGAPSGMSYGSVYHLGGSGGGSVLSLQIAADINHNSTSSTKQLWFRTSNNLGFQNDWKELLHSGNYSSYALPLSGGTLTGALTVGTTSSGSQARALRVAPTGTNPSSFGSYAGSWRSTIEIWDNNATRMLHLTPPDGTNYNYSSIKSTDAGLRIDVGGSGGTNAIDIGTNGVANFPQGLQQGGNQVLHAGNYTSYSPSLTGTGASGTWSINITGSAGSATDSTKLPLSGGTVTGFLGVGGNPGSDDGNWGARLNVGGNPHARIDARCANDGIVTTVYSHQGQNRGYVGTMSNHRLALGVNGSEVQSVYSGYSESIGSYRAPVFYDSNNTGYYMDPSSSGNVQGNWEFSATDNSSTSYSVAAIELRESNKGGSSAYLAPRLAFHWGGVVASQISIDSGGAITIRNNPGTGYENLIGNILYGDASVRAPIWYDYNDTSFYLDAASTTTSLQIAGAIEQGNNFARPNVEWSASSSSSGMVIFKLPGGSGNYGMVHMVFDIYEYNSPRIATVIVGGHNWNGSWYNHACNVIGYTDKQVRLGFKDGQYCVVFGTSGSGWSYGTIRLRKIHNGSFYNNQMDLGGSYSVSQTTTESFSAITGDLRGLRTPSTMEVDGILYGYNSIRSNIFYDNDNTGYYLDPTGSSRLSTIYCGDVYNDLGGWFRNYGATGLYNQSYGNHFYSDSANYWNVGIGGQTSGGIRFRDNHAGTVRGYVYVDNGNNIGFLNSGGSWRARVVADDYFLVDGSSARAQLFYDSNDTSYYCNPNDWSQLWGTKSYYLANITGVGTDHPFGVYFDSGLSGAYGIYRESGAWTHPYPDLRIAFHTGIKLGANQSYNGIRFYNDYNMAGQVMSVNNGADPLGADNVYVNNSLQAGSSLRAPIFYDSNDTNYYTDPAGTSVLSTLRTTSQIYINNGDPTIFLQDTSHRSSMIHCNSNVFYILRGSGTNSTGWSTYNGYWPLEFNLENNDALLGGNITAVYNVTAYSDERLKKNWRPLYEGFVERLAGVKNGIYERISKEEETEITQVGVSAQSLREVLPEAVTEASDEMKTLSVSYGNAALAAAVELAKEVVTLKSQISAMLVEINSLKEKLQ